MLTDDTRESTTDGRSPEDVRAEQKIDGNTLHKSYIVLSEAERAKGFVRPVRQVYRHTRCGTETTMGLALSETYAREPEFYGMTYCCACGQHYPVGERGEFVWLDGEKVGT